MVWEPRTYRRIVEPEGLVTFEVVRAETDLQIGASRDLSAEAAALVGALRADLDAYVAAHPYFAESFVPVEVEDDAPEVVRAMAEAARSAAVGPMAAVAGAVAERVARGLSAQAAEVIVENGGDIFILGTRPRTVLVAAGDSPLTGTVALAFARDDLPVAVCTSSGTVGPSVSLGIANAVTIVAEDGALADAVASAAGNLVHGADDIAEALECAMSVPGVRGAVIIVGDHIGAMGQLDLVRIGE
jgi:hypothetical protein